MTTPDPIDAIHPTLTRMVDAAREIRPLQDAERRALFERITGRSQRASSLHRWQVGVALAGALAFAALQLGVPGLSGPSGSEVPASPRLLAPASQNAAAAPTTTAPGSKALASAPQPAAPAPLRPLVPSPSTSPGERVVSLDGVGEFTLEAGAELSPPASMETDSGRRLVMRMQRGRIRARIAPRPPDEPFAIVTPHAAVVVIGTCFTVSVERGCTAVSVEHGRVRVEHAGQSALLDSGQSLRSDEAWPAPPARPSAPTARAAASMAPTSASPAPGASPQAGRCQGDAAARRECLRRASRGTDLNAQNALFALALLERDERGDGSEALARLDEYEQRHAQGVLAPEVALARVQTLLQQGELPAARAAVGRYARSNPDDRTTRERLEALLAAAEGTSPP